MIEIALASGPLTAEEAREYGLVNRVVGKGKCVEEVLKLAELVMANSLGSVIMSREGVKMGWEGISVEEGTRLT